MPRLIMVARSATEQSAPPRKREMDAVVVARPSVELATFGAGQDTGNVRIEVTGRGHSSSMALA